MNAENQERGYQKYQMSARMGSQFNVGSTLKCQRECWRRTGPLFPHRQNFHVSFQTGKHGHAHQCHTHTFITAPAIQTRHLVSPVRNTLCSTLHSVPNNMQMIVNNPMPEFYLQQQQLCKLSCSLSLAMP